MKPVTIAKKSWGVCYGTGDVNGYHGKGKGMH